MEQPKEYYAFISYKREDKKEAKWLQHALEYYRLPNHLRQENPELPEYVRPVFRDMTDLEVGELSAQLHAALEQSHFLIVVCSPRAATSKWVNDEVEYFISLGKQDKIIPYIIEGVPHASNPSEECYPPALLNLSKEKELLGANINEVGKDSATIRVVSRMFNIRFDTLYQRYQRDKKKRRRQLSAAIVLAFLFLLGIAGWIWHQNILLKEREWKLLEVQASLVSNKAMALIEEGDVIHGIALIMKILPNDLDNPNRPLLPETERALRAANDSLIYGQNVICVMNRPIIDSIRINTVFETTASRNKTIRMWNKHIWGRYMEWISSDFYYPRFVALSPDDKSLVKEYEDNGNHTLSVWELNDDSLVFVKKITDGEHPLFSKDGKKLYVECYVDDSTGFKRNEIVYETCTWDSVSTLIDEGYYSPDRSLLVEDTGECLKVLDSHDKTLIRQCNLPKLSVHEIIQGSDNSIVISDNNKYIKYYQYIVDIEKNHFVPYEGTFMTFSDNGDIMITENTKYSEDFSKSVHWISMINPKDGMEMVDKRRYFPSRVDFVRECPEGNLFVGTDKSSYVIKSPLISPKQRWEARLMASDSEFGPNVIFNTDCKCALIYERDSITFYSTQDWKWKSINKTLNPGTHPFAINANGTKIIVGKLSAFSRDYGWGNTWREYLCDILLYDMNTHTVDTLYKKLKDIFMTYNHCFAFSNDDNYVAIGKGQEIIIWDIQKKAIVNKMQGHTSEINSLSFSRDDKYLITSASDKSTRIWDMNKYQEVKSKIICNDGNKLAIISPDNSYIAIANDNNIYLYNFHNCSLSEIIPCRMSYHIGFSDDGTTIYSLNRGEDKVILYQHKIESFKSIIDKYKYFINGHS